MNPIYYWKFESSINKAIELLILKYRTQRSGFRVQFSGIDYGGAIARMLYTCAFNDRLLRLHFIRLVEKGERPKWIMVPSDLAALARELMPIWGIFHTRVIGIPTRRQLYRYFFYFPWFLRAFGLLKSLGDPTATSIKKKNKSVSILCFAHHKKFVALIKPIVVELGMPYVFLVRDRREQMLFELRDDEVAFMPPTPLKIWGSELKTAWPDITNFAFRFDDILRQLKPEMLIYCEGDAWHLDLISHVGKKYLIPSVCMQWGAFPYPTPRIGIREMGCSAFLSWGDYFCKQLKPYNPSTQFISVGHHGLKLSVPDQFNKRIIFLLNTDPNGKVTGIDAYHEQFWSLLLWVAEHAVGWTIIVRLHPMIPLSPSEKDLLSRFKIIQVHEPSSKTLFESIDGCDLAITVSSSSVIEAAACGVVPFIFNPAPWSFQPDFHLVGAGFEFNELPLAIEKMKDLLLNPSDLEEVRKNLIQFRQNIFLAVGSVALKNTVITIKSMMLSNNTEKI